MLYDFTKQNIITLLPQHDDVMICNTVERLCYCFN